MVQKGLGRLNHVANYLYDMHRRGCRPNTIRSAACAILYFLSHLKHQRHVHIETITRDDLGSYIEKEQDRGLKPSTIASRVKCLNPTGRSCRTCIANFILKSHSAF